MSRISQAYDFIQDCLDDEVICSIKIWDKIKRFEGKPECPFTKIIDKLMTVSYRFEDGSEITRSRFAPSPLLVDAEIKERLM